MSNQYNVGDEIFNDVLVIDKFGGEEKSGFGVVYIVMDKNMGLILAIKTLQKEQISSHDFEIIKNEIMHWIDVSNHPNIVSAFTIELDDDKRPYILMEPISPDEFGKQTLTDFMKGGKLTEEQILKWCIQFCYAMEYVNQKGHIHGDIKPDNILINDGIVKITDFGLAKSINDVNNDYYGSRCYLSPESWDGIKNVSSEIYSFGVVMYQMCNGGVLPFDGFTDEEWKNFHKCGDVPPLDHGLFPYIEKCLEKNPEDRFLSFSQLNDVLIMRLNEKFSQKIEKPKLVDIGNIKNVGNGHLAAALGDIENCKKYYEIAIENSDEELTRYNYALDLIDLRQFEDALNQLMILVENLEAIPLERIYFNIGKCYHEGICLYKSIEYYKKAIEINETDLKSHTNLGNVYREYGFYDDALVHYKCVLQQDDKFSYALVNISDLYLKMGDKKNFEIFSSKIDVIQIDPSVDYYRGLILKEQNLLKFLSSMDNVAGEYRHQIPALVQLFKFHLENKNIPEANGKFDEIFEASKDINLVMGLCFLYGDYGFPDEAIIKFDYIYDLVMGKEDVLFKKAIFLQGIESRESITICNSLLNEKIDDKFKSKVYVILGNCYSKIDADKSFDCYLRALDLNPKNITSLKNLAVHHAEKGDYFIAEGYVDDGLEFEKNDYDLLLLKANLCNSQFKYGEAIKYYSKCLKLAPSSEIYSYLGACFGSLQKFEIAIFYLELANNLNYDGHFDMGLFSLYVMTLVGGGYIDEDYLKEIIIFS